MTDRLAGSDLLARLGSGVRPDGASSALARDVSRADFGELLDRAMGGALASGRSVEVMPDAGVTLSADQIARVSDASDRAELAGMSRALMQIDGMELVVDVPMRRVLGEAAMDDRGVIAGVDGIVRVSGDARADDAGVGGLLRGDLNASLMDVLGRRNG